VLRSEHIECGDDRASLDSSAARASSTRRRRWNSLASSLGKMPTTLIWLGRFEMQARVKRSVK
jgi:hypothetical protein